MTNNRYEKSHQMNFFYKDIRKSGFAISGMGFSEALTKIVIKI